MNENVQPTFENLPYLVNQLIAEVRSLKESTNNENEPSSHYSREEAKKILGVKSDVTMISWEQKNILSPKRVGRKVFYVKSEIDKLLQ